MAGSIKTDAGKTDAGGWLRHLRWPGSGPATAAPVRLEPVEAGVAPRGVDGNADPLPAQPTAAMACYRDLFEHAPVGYMLLDAAGCIDRINRTGARMLGWGANWLAGQLFSRWVEANDVAAFDDYRRQIGSDDACLSHELRIKNHQGRIVSLRMEGVRGSIDEDGTVGCKTGGCRMIMIDISGEQQSARELRRLQLQLNHVARLNTVGELAASLAHELNQPLGVVVLNCEAALRLLGDGTSSGDKAGEINEALTQAAEAASFASGVVRHLRGFLRDNEEPRQTCNLRILIDDVSSLIRADARDSDMDVQLDIAPDLPEIRVDVVQIEQVLLNLAHNSIEAMREQGKGANKVVIRARLQTPHRILVSVTDTGPGLDPQQHEQLFTAFYTTKRNGMGMGLCISRTIIEAHGGRLWVSGEIGDGATFHFTLPTNAGLADGD